MRYFDTVTAQLFLHLFVDLTTAMSVRSDLTQLRLDFLRVTRHETEERPQIKNVNGKIYVLVKASHLDLLG